MPARPTPPTAVSMASMSAQTVTPILLGLLLTRAGAWGVLPVYVTVLIAVSTTVFIVFVKNIRGGGNNAKGLEAFAGED